MKHKNKVSMDALFRLKDGMFEKNLSRKIYKKNLN